MTLWGSSSTHFRRLLDPAYASANSVPRGGYTSATDTCERTGNNSQKTFSAPCKRDPGSLLPNARRVSIEFHPDTVAEDTTVSQSRLFYNSVRGWISRATGDTQILICVI
jgi:hypothetical protein